MKSKFQLLCIKHYGLAFYTFIILIAIAILLSAINLVLKYELSKEEIKVVISYQQQDYYIEENQKLANIINEYKNFDTLNILNPEENTEPHFNPNDITEPSNITVDDMRRILKGTRLEGLAEGYILAEKISGINALFLYGLTANESGYGSSRLAREKNNISGFAAYDSSPYDSASYFKSKTHCVMATAMLLRDNYVKEGLITVRNINNKYATDVNWNKKIKNIVYVGLNTINNYEIASK